MRALQVLFWFLWQSTHSPFVWIPLALIVVVMIVVLFRSEPIERWKYCLLALLPAMWIFIGLWGGQFWLHWEQTPNLANPAWVQYPLAAGVPIFCAVGVILIVYLSGIRAFTTLFFLLNLYFMLAMTVLAGMAVTGDWL